MKLADVEKLLVATDGPQHALLKIDDPEAEFEIRLMAEVGLVEATLGDGGEGSFTIVHGLTRLGFDFLRAFKEAQPPANPPRSGLRYAARRQSAHRAVLKKWNTNFALDFHWPQRTD